MRAAAIVLVLGAGLLSACSGNPLPFSKSNDAASSRQATRVPPPLDGLAEAGEGAEQEIDYETLHGPGAAPVPDSVAGVQPPAPEIASADSSAEAPSASADNSIEGVAITGVSGAGKAGNGELATALARVLTDAGWPVKEAPGSNVLTIQGDVSLSEPSGEAQKVALRWTVKAPDGQVLGAVDQANDVPAGSLDDGWGDAADHAAMAAAQGIFDLVDKLR